MSKLAAEMLQHTAEEIVIRGALQKASSTTPAQPKIIHAPAMPNLKEETAN